MTPSQSNEIPEETILEVRGLKKSYGNKQVLKGIDLTVTRADVFVIIGPNGCGKSTFLRCLNWMEPYQEGEVLLRGEVASWGRPEGYRLTTPEKRQIRHLRQRVGMVFQQYNLFPHLSVINNVMIGPQQVLGKTRLDAQSIAEQMLEKVGLWQKRNDDPKTLSGGQQQRVAIARALAMNPDVVLFDEVTSALDPQLTFEVLKVIKDLVFQDGLTSIMISHDMKFSREIADQIIYMDAGLIEVQGTPEEILENQTNPKLISFLNPGLKPTAGGALPENQPS